MKATTAEIFNARYKAITDALPKDENGFVGSNAAERFDNMMLHFVMAWNGVSKAEARAMRKKAVAEHMERETQESIAQAWP